MHSCKEQARYTLPMYALNFASIENGMPMYALNFVSVIDVTRFGYKSFVGLCAVEDSKKAGTLLRSCLFWLPLSELVA